MQKLLITGSNGLLGQKLIDLILSKKEWELIATSRGEERVHHEGDYLYESLDLLNKEQLALTIKKHQPDVIINTAGMTNVDLCESEKEACLAANIESVKNVVEVCNENDVFLIHLSTDFIFDGLAGPYDEEAIPNPVNFYGKCKLAGEKVIMNDSKSWAIARTILVYGVTEKMSRSNLILFVKGKLESGESIQVVDDQWRSPTYAEDLAIGCLLIAEKKAEGIFNLGGGNEEPITPYQMAIATAEEFGLDKSLISKTDGAYFKQDAKRPPKTGLLLTKSKNILGYIPKTFAEGLKELAKQLQ